MGITEVIFAFLVETLFPLPYFSFGKMGPFLQEQKVG